MNSRGCLSNASLEATDRDDHGGSLAGYVRIRKVTGYSGRRVLKVGEERTSPFLSELVDDVLPGEVEVDHRRLDVIVTEGHLQGAEVDALLERGDSEGMTQDVGSTRPADVCAVGNALHGVLQGALRLAKRFVQREVVLDK